MNLIDIVDEGRHQPPGFFFYPSSLSASIGGLRKGMLTLIASEPKVGKTTFSLYVLLTAILNNFEQIKKENSMLIEYYSLEMPLQEIILKIAVFLIHNKYGIHYFKIDGEEHLVETNLLAGRKMNREGKRILVPEKFNDFLKQVENEYLNTIINIFNFHNVAENPTGIRNYLINEMSNYGTTKVDMINTGTRTKKMQRFIPYNKNQLIMVVIDHFALLPRERGYSTHENMAKMMEYLITIRNIYGVSGIIISHLNRGIAGRTGSKEFLFPGQSDIKNSGSMVEGVDLALTLFNPKDPFYGIKKHFGRDLKGLKNIRSMHVIASRYSSPFHSHLIIEGDKMMIKELKPIENG